MPLRTSPDRSALAALAAAATPAHLALGRTGAGAVMVLRPTALPRLLGVDPATATSVGWSVQMLGAREIALGLGTLAAGRRDRLWVAAGVLCDAVDVLAVAGALVKGRVGRAPGAAVLAVALAATALGARALRQDEPGI